MFVAVTNFCDENSYGINSGCIQTGPALESAGPNARPRRGAPLDSGVIRSSCSVNRAM